MVKYGEVQDLFADATSREWLMRSRRMSLARLDRFHREEVAFNEAVAVAKAQKAEALAMEKSSPAVASSVGRPQSETLAKVSDSHRSEKPGYSGILVEGVSLMGGADGDPIGSTPAGRVQEAPAPSTAQVAQEVQENPVPGNWGQNPLLAQQPAPSVNAPVPADVASYAIGQDQLEGGKAIPSPEISPQPLGNARVNPDFQVWRTASGGSVVSARGDPVTSSQYSSSAHHNQGGRSLGALPLGEFAPKGSPSETSWQHVDSGVSPAVSAPSLPGALSGVQGVQAASGNGAPASQPSQPRVGSADARVVYADVLRKFGTDVDLLLSYDSSDHYDARVLYADALRASDSIPFTNGQTSRSEQSRDQALAVLMQPPMERSEALAVAERYGGALPSGSKAEETLAFADSVEREAAKSVAATLKSDQPSAAVREEARVRLAAVRDRAGQTDSSSSALPAQVTESSRVIASEIDQTIASQLNKMASEVSRSAVFTQSATDLSSLSSDLARKTSLSDGSGDGRSVQDSSSLGISGTGQPLGVSLGADVEGARRLISAAPEFETSPQARAVRLDSVASSIEQTKGFVGAGSVVDDGDLPQSSPVGVLDSEPLPLAQEVQRQPTRTVQGVLDSVMPEPLASVSLTGSMLMDDRGGGESQERVSAVSSGGDLNLREDMQAALRRYAAIGRRVVQG